jgi:hypothetical protein
MVIDAAFAVVGARHHVGDQFALASFSAISLIQLITALRTGAVLRLTMAWSAPWLSCPTQPFAHQLFH